MVETFNKISESIKRFNDVFVFKKERRKSFFSKIGGAIGLNKKEEKRESSVVQRRPNLITLANKRRSKPKDKKINNPKSVDSKIKRLENRIKERKKKMEMKMKEI